MRSMTFLTVFGVVCATTFAAHHDGTWKMNIAKSKGVGDITSRTMKITEAGPKTFHYEFEETRNGKTTKNTDTRVCDGREHRNERSSSYTCNDAKTIFLRDGKPALEYKHSFSSDGNTLTNAVTGWDKDGKVIRSEVRVFERQ